jgi:hypothetical protein
MRKSSLKRRRTFRGSDSPSEGRDDGGSGGDSIFDGGVLLPYASPGDAGSPCWVNIRGGGKLLATCTTTGEETTPVATRFCQPRDVVEMLNNQCLRPRRREAEGVLNTPLALPCTSLPLPLYWLATALNWAVGSRCMWLTQFVAF